MAEVDHAVMDKGSTIVDANNSTASVPKVGHAHFGTEGKCAMGCRHRAGLIDLAIRCSVAIKTGAIPTGFTGDDFDNLRNDLQLRLGEFRGRWCKNRFELCRRKRCLQPRGLGLDHQIQRVKGLRTVERKEIAGHDRQEGRTT